MIIGLYVNVCRGIMALDFKFLFESRPKHKTLNEGNLREMGEKTCNLEEKLT